MSKRITPFAAALVVVTGFAISASAQPAPAPTPLPSVDSKGIRGLIYLPSFDDERVLFGQDLTAKEITLRLKNGWARSSQPADRKIHRTQAYNRFAITLISRDELVAKCGVRSKSRYVRVKVTTARQPGERTRTITQLQCR